MQLAEHENDLDKARREAWVLEQLIHVGYKPHRAEQLVRADVDWHEACELIARGCDQKTALRILL